MDPASQAEIPQADEPAEFDEFTIVLLYRGANPPKLSEEDSERLQRQHLGHLDAMRQRGAMIAAGPLSDQPDENLRGICIYRAGLEEARSLAESDPAVRRGRFRIVAFRWYTGKGSLRDA